MEHVATRRDEAAWQLTELVEAGVVAGVAAGIGMACWLVVYGMSTDLGWLTPLKLIGGTFYRHSALEPGLGAVFWGTVLHLAVSAAFGVLYAFLAARRGLDPFSEVAAAVVYGLLLWAFMDFLVMPLVDPFMKARVSNLAAAWFGAHVVYGAILGVVPQLRRNVPPAR